MPWSLVGAVGLAVVPGTTVWEDVSSNPRFDSLEYLSLSIKPSKLKVSGQRFSPSSFQSYTIIIIKVTFYNSLYGGQRWLALTMLRATQASSR